MSLLLSLLGTAAIATSTISAPIVVSQETQVSPQINKSGVYEIKNAFVSSKTTTDLDKENDVQILSVSIPWIDLGITEKDYVHMTRSASRLMLRTTLTYANNANPKDVENITIHKSESFRGLNDDLGIFFDHKISYDDNGTIWNDTQTVTHNWEYTFSDAGYALQIDARVLTSASSTIEQPTWSYAGISFDSLYFDITI